MISQLQKLKIANNILSIIVIIFAVYLIFFPYWPRISHALFPTAEIIVPRENAPTISSLFGDVSGNWLLIPSIGVRREIIESDTIKTVHENIWRRPLGSSPEKGGNTIMVAHRYATIGGNRASTFYDLPNLVVGDKIYVKWNDVLYTYQVRDTEIVPKTAIEIENNTPYPLLTLYTCTPLWTAENRFVVRAVPI